MKASQIFKLVALAGAGAYAVSKVKENPELFGRVVTSRERAHQLIDHLGNAYNLSPFITDLAKDHTGRFYEPPAQSVPHRTDDVIDVTPRKVT